MMNLRQKKRCWSIIRRSEEEMGHWVTKIPNGQSIFAPRDRRKLKVKHVHRGKEERNIVEVGF